MIHTRSSRPTTRLSWTRRFPLTRRTGDSRTRNVTTTGSQTRRERWSGSSAPSGCMTAASCVKRSLQRLIYILQCIHLQILINLQLDQQYIINDSINHCYMRLLCRNIYGILFLVVWGEFLSGWRLNTTQLISFKEKRNTQTNYNCICYGESCF